jgi:acetylglutamate/LysW-gamma-L-alpha-aminoadipate kinase
LVVVKVGGTLAGDVDAVSRDLAELVAQGTRPVVVHGGSADIAALTSRLGLPDRRLVSPDGMATRHTDEAALEAITLAMCGITKPRLVGALNAVGVAAVGLTGLDAGLIRARRKHTHRAVVDGRTVLVRNNHSGRVSRVNTELLRTLLTAGLVPVLSPPVLAEDGRPVNADADRVAAAVAGALGAETLILLTGAAGVLADPDDPGSTLTELSVEPDALPAYAGGGMRMKLIAATEALHAGVGQVLIGDGRVRHPIRQAVSGESSTSVVLRRPAC